MTAIILFNKPFNVLCQFADREGRATLSEYISTQTFPRYHTAGRLDRDSEGLLILTDNGALQHRITDPLNKFSKRYWVQLEGDIGSNKIRQLASGVVLSEGVTRPAKVRRIPAPEIWPRNPPVRFRRQVPTCWIEITLTEGRNRQVRRMTAAVGHPTLRLVRVAIGPWQLQALAPGEYRIEQIHLPR